MTMNFMDSKTKRNRFTRMCIGEALLTLIPESELSKISIFNICKKAGVSRRTYYNYYVTKEDVLFDYLSEVINEYMYQLRQSEIIGKIISYEHILFTIQFLNQYKNFFLVLSNAGLYSLIINTVNDYIDNYCIEETNNNAFELYCYFGAILNSFTKWASKDTDTSPEVLANILHNFLRKEHR